MDGFEEGGLATLGLDFSIFAALEIISLGQSSQPYKGREADQSKQASKAH